MEKNIVVVDDESRIRKIYKRLLSTAGFNVLEAANANSANEIVKHNKVDLVLLDIKMPEVQGDILFEVLQAFHKQTKVLITSVYPLEEQKRLAAGANDYYDKSQGLAVLLKKIHQLVSNS